MTKENKHTAYPICQGSLLGFVWEFREKGKEVLWGT